MGALSRELWLSPFRWLLLAAGGIAAALHAGEGASSWAEAMLPAEQTARIMFPLCLMLACWEALRSRRHRLLLAERTASRGLLSIRIAQVTAVLLWSAVAAFGALGIGLLVSRGADGVLEGPVLLSPLPGLTPLLGAALGLFCGSLLRHWSALLLALLLAAAPFAAQVWLDPGWWSLLNPVLPQLAASPELQALLPRGAMFGVEVVSDSLPAGLVAVIEARVLWALALVVGAIGLVMLALRPRTLELIGAVVVVVCGTALGIVAALWLQHLVV